MSGGHFDYKQYCISTIADEIDRLIESRREDKVYSDDTISEFRRAVQALRVAYVYAQRIDWLVSADDGEDDFHRRLKSDLDEIKQDLVT
jgi:hypothetical protein